MTNEARRRALRPAVLACLAACVMGFGTPAVAETLEQRVERMERELGELKAELRRRNEADRHRVEADRRREAADRRRAEADRQRETDAAANRPAAAPAPAAPAPPAPVASENGALAAIVDRVRLGGYGSLRYEGSTLENQDQGFTFRRFVLTTDAAIAPRLRAYMELEFEHFRKLELEKSTQQNGTGGLTFKQAIEGTDDSEISFEQLWFQYDVADWVKLRLGEVLVPVGRFNLNHDDDRWNLPRRSLVDRGVSVLPIPAAWSELGAGFLGDVPVGDQGILSYQAYVVNGVALDSSFEQVVASRKGDTTKNEIDIEVQPATGTFNGDVKNAKAVTGRLGWSPALGHDVGASGYFGQYTPDFLGKENLWSLAADGHTGYGPFELEGEYVYTHYEGIRSVAQRLAQAAITSEAESEAGNVETEVEFELAGLARTKHGYWLEGRYHFWPAFLSDTVLGRHFDNPEFVAVLRGETVWLDDLVSSAAFSNGHLTSFDQQNRYVGRVTAGIAYRPVPLVAFQLAYEFTQTNDGQSLADVTNFLPAGPHEDHAHSILFGATFGF
jgi:hypothetical protein